MTAMTDSIALLRWTFLIAVPVATLISLLVYVSFAPSGPDEGKLKLPLHSNQSHGASGYTRIAPHADEDEDQGGNEDNVTKGDPFDIIDDEVALDGYPIQEEAFWRKVYFRKIMFAISLVPPTVINLVALGLHLSSLSENIVHSRVLTSYATMSYILLVPFHVYLLFQAIHYLGLNDVDRHWFLTVHLSAVLFVGFFTQFLMVLLPADPSISAVTPKMLLFALASGPRKTIEILRALQPALLLVAGLLVGTTPRGPKLHFPLEKIYTPKTIASLKEMAQSDEATPSSKTALDPSVPNVTGEASGSVIDYLFFNYCMAIIKTAQTSTSLDVWDLPVVRANMRALGLYKAMRKAYGETQKKRVTRRDALKAGRGLPPGWNLLWKVYKVNGHQFAIRELSR